MVKTVCRICLSSDFTRTGDIHEILSDFHDELCEYDAYQNPMLQFCPVCEHLLRKFYKFREKCKKAHSILKSAANRKLPLDDLHKLTTPTIAYATARSHQKVISIKCTELSSEVKYATNTTSNHNDDIDRYKSDDNVPENASNFDVQEESSKLNFAINGKIITKSIHDGKSKNNVSTLNAENASENFLLKQISKNTFVKIRDMKRDLRRSQANATLNSNETNQPKMSSPETKIQKLSNLKPNYYSVYSCQQSKTNPKTEIDNKLPVRQYCDRKAEDTNEEKTDSVTQGDTNNRLADDLNHQTDFYNILQENDIEISNDMEIADDIEYIESDLEDNKKEVVVGFKTETDKTKEVKPNNEKPIKIEPVEMGLIKIRPKVRNEKGQISIIPDENNTMKPVENNLVQIGPHEKKLSITKPCDIDINKIKPYNINMDLYEDINIPELLNILENKQFKKILCFSKSTQDYAVRLYKQKEIILEYMKAGELRELGDGVSMSEELYLKLLNNNISHVGIVHINTLSKRLEALKKHLLDLYKCNNPDYHSLFTIERLNTKEKKIAEFQGRRNEWFASALAKCESCVSVYATKGYLRNHRKLMHDPTNTEICPICSVRTNKYTILKHMRTLHAFLYRCKKCPFLSTNNNAMVQHYRLHNEPVQPWPACRLCDTTFRDEKNRKTHMAIMHKGESVPGSLSSDSCGVSLEDRVADSLRQHIARHKEGSFKFWCCGKMFNCMEDKRAHLLRCLKRKHSIRPPKMPRGVLKDLKTRKTRIKVGNLEYRTCPVCQEKVKNVNPMSLYRHHKATHPETTFQAHYNRSLELCSLCGKSVSSKTYRDHLNTHTGERPYACSCGARFATQYQRVKHRDTHKQHLCPDCGKQFPSRRNLLKHIRAVHMVSAKPRERKHKCHICPKAFLYPDNLRTHLKGVHFKTLPVRMRKKAIQDDK